MKKDLINNLKLERLAKDKSKKGFNFVGDVDNWTTPEEQKIKVKEIEDIDK